MAWEEVTIGPCRLIRGDALEVLPTLKGISAIITDPPYGLNVKYDAYEDDPETHPQKCKTWLAAMRQAAPLILVFTSIGSLFYWEKPDWIVAWHKNFSVTHSPFGANNWEPIAVYGKPGRNDRQSDFFSATFVRIDKMDFPCPKPVNAMAQLICMASKKGACIADPFMGSGTTGLACMALRRFFIGIEIGHRAFDLSCQRIEAAYQQLDLFHDALPHIPPQQLTLA